MKKKILSLILAIVMVLPLCPVFEVPLLGTSAFAAGSDAAISYVRDPTKAKGSDYTSNTKLAQVLNEVFAGDVDAFSDSKCTNEIKMPIGGKFSTTAGDPIQKDVSYYIKSKTTGTVISGKQCYIYANAVYNKLYHEWVGNGASLSHSYKVFSGGGQTLSYEMFRDAQVKTGAMLRTTNDKNGKYSGNNGHNIIVLSYDTEKISYLEGNAEQSRYIQITTQSWDNFNYDKFKDTNDGDRYISFLIQPIDDKYYELYSSCTHPSYDDKGICTNAECKYQFPYDNKRDTSFAGTYKVKSGATAYIRTGPYQGCTEVTRVTSGTFSVDARVYNCKGNYWYELLYNGKICYIVSGNLEPTGHIHNYSAATCTSPKKCTICGATTGSALGHTYDNACDATCNRCGATRTPAAHVYTNACDEYCNVCFALRSVPGHSYDNNCDTTCNICGHTRTPSAHVYTNACDEYCNVCFALRSVPGHSYDNNCDTTCNICGHTRTITHSYTTVGYDDTHPHKEYKKCSCGAIQYTGAERNAWDEALHYDEAHPHYVYQLCIPCGWKEYNGRIETATVSTCVDCNPVGAATISLSATKVAVGEKVTVSWSAVSNAKEYNVKYYDSNNEYHLICTTTELSAEISFDTVGTYTIYVDSVGKNGDYKKSNEISLTVSKLYVVTYDLNGGTGDFPSTTSESSTIQLTNRIPEKEGFRFVGWSFEPNDASIMTVGSTYYLVAGQSTSYTVIAQWECSPHTYDNACDTDCNVCGETRNVTHTFSNACDADCNVCGETRTPAAHVYDDENDKTCNVCGAFSGLSGITGECTWTLEGTKLTISGNGAMGDYNNSSTPWGTSVEKVIIENGVTSIGNDTFKNCGRITGIIIPDSVKSIGDRAFWNCKALKNISFGGGITNIGDYTFGYCSALSEFIIPGSVTTIGRGVFEYCNNLKSVTLGKSVTSIGSSAFPGCTELGSITVSEENKTFHSAGNCVIETSSKTLIAGCKASVIPSDGSVTSIGERAFSFCTALTKVTIPDSVTSIGDYAFWCCTSLTSVTIPDSVTSIGDYAFDGCAALTDVWYEGSEADRGAISIDSNNKALTNATWHYNSCIKNAPSYVHSYDNGCDADCNVCGATRTVGAHVYDNGCDATCNTCGATRTTTHTYDNDCDKTCNVCGATRTVGAHVYDNACDSTCNECGATRTTTHTYDNDCDKTCNVCSAVRSVSGHIYDNEDDNICNVCGAERTISHELKISFSKSTVDHGETFTVSVSLSKPVISKGFALDYAEIFDQDAFEFVSGTWSDAVKSQSLMAPANNGQAAFVAQNEFEISGEIFTLTLRVKDMAKCGVQKIEAPAITQIQGVTRVGGEITVNHIFDDAKDLVCNVCGFERPAYIPGDVDGNEDLNMDDAIHLLFHVNFPESYPVNQSIDFDGNGKVDMDDAIYLLFYVNFPESYPLH